MQLTLPFDVLELLRLLNGSGYEAYVVGGSARDLLRGVVPHDYDITTSATPDEMQEVFRDYRVIETGIRHGTVTVLMNGTPYEITTYRLDGDYGDHRHPDGVTFTRSLEEDLARRDFTCNAIAYHPDRGIVDPHGGIKDIQAGILRAVGDPERRFTEDALRILRALRFASVLGYTVDEATRVAVIKGKEDLAFVAKERVREELMKLLAGKNAPAVLSDYRDVIAVILPDLIPTFAQEQRTPYHTDKVYDHIVKTVSNLPPDPVLRLAALLHDIAKPGLHTCDAEGIDHFKGHAEAGAVCADAILKDLRFDNKTRERVTKLVRLHEIRIPATEPAVKRLLIEAGREDFSDLIALARADMQAHNMKHPPAREALAVLEQIGVIGLSHIGDGTPLSVGELAVNGKDVMENTPLRGQAVGDALRRLFDDVTDGVVENRREDLLKRLRNEK